MNETQEIESNILSVNEKINAALDRSGRDISELKLVAVSKKQPVSKINAFLGCSYLQLKPIIGENYVQEFRDKKPEIAGSFEAHLIGPLQSNKAKLAVELFDVIETVHTLKLAEALDKAAEGFGKAQRVFIQVNISDDPNKSGIAPEELNSFYKELSALTNIKIEGIMTITRFYEDPELVRPDFKKMFAIKKDLEQEAGAALELSMGMSSDYEIAIEEGATVIRVGTAIFGKR